MWWWRECCHRYRVCCLRRHRNWLYPVVLLKEKNDVMNVVQMLSGVILPQRYFHIVIGGEEMWYPRRHGPWGIFCKHIPFAKFFVVKRSRSRVPFGITRGIYQEITWTLGRIKSLFHSEYRGISFLFSFRMFLTKIFTSLLLSEYFGQKHPSGKQKWYPPPPREITDNVVKWFHGSILCKQIPTNDWSLK